MKNDNNTIFWSIASVMLQRTVASPSTTCYVIVHRALLSPLIDPCLLLVVLSRALRTPSEESLISAKLTFALLSLMIELLCV